MAAWISTVSDRIRSASQQKNVHIDPHHRSPREFCDVWYLSTTIWTTHQRVPSHIYGNDCTERSAYPCNSDDVLQISASYMGTIREESRYVQIRASSLGYGTLVPGCSSMAVVGSVADQQLGQIVGYMRQQGIKATVHVCWVKTNRQMYRTTALYKDTSF